MYVEKTAHGNFYRLRQEEAQLTNEEREIALHLLGIAETAIAEPYQSGFHVRAAIMNDKGDIDVGGNDEYAFSDAFVHGETSALAASLAKHGRQPMKALAFYSLFSPPDLEKEPVGGSCGNCRDVFNEYGNPEMMIFEGDGKNWISVTRQRDYLFDDFQPMEPASISKEGLEEAVNGISIGVEEYLPEHLRKGVYGVALVGESGRVWKGSLDTNAGYDATTPLVAAKQVWRNAEPEAKLKKIVIAVGGEDIPKPLYRDRQAAMELDESLMLYTGRTQPLRVELLQVDNSGQIVKASITNTREWMPIPFTAGSFGMTDAVQGSLRGLKL